MITFKQFSQYVSESHDLDWSQKSPSEWKRAEHQAEWEREREYSRHLRQQRAGEHHVIINGKKWKTFADADHAHAAAATVHRKTGKEVRVNSELNGKPHPHVRSVVFAAKK